MGKLPSGGDARGAVSSTDNGRDSLTKSISTGSMIPDAEPNVKRQFSISESVQKRDGVKDLKDILRRGGDTAELRQHVAQMERNTNPSAQTDIGTDSTAQEAQQILANANRQGISVDEYLRRNWEQYDIDGEWNAAARQALEMEKVQQGRKYSISPIFISEIDAWNGKAEKTFLVGSTSSALQSLY